MSHFFAYLSRMRFIKRWGLMHNVHEENIQEHSHHVAAIAHTLAIISNKLFDGNINADRVATLALYHDANEVITGDLPTPIKYFSPKIKEAYKEIEKIADERLYEMLPEEIRGEFKHIFFPTTEEDALWATVKAADKISAYLKCLEEQKAGNQEFRRAEQVLLQSVTDLDLPEVNWFMERFVPSMKLTLDELE
ncbi:MAG: 5'-deoxynucleotidase [Bacteroidia bacterium]